MLTLSAIWCAALSAVMAQRIVATGFTDEEAPFVGLMCGTLLAPGVAVMLLRAFS